MIVIGLIHPCTGLQREVSVMYSSVYPMLLLLSRLLPFPLKAKKKVKSVRVQALPDAFIPLVTRCSDQSNFKVTNNLIQV